MNDIHSNGILIDNALRHCYICLPGKYVFAVLDGGSIILKHYEHM